ncbi:hypothetical protein O0L34_g16519 [Tuta absoluta]|nr:hypothetical protein O0L34_g16519 [Tuta absoluta]
MPQQTEINNPELPDYSDVLEETQQILRQCFKQFKLEEIFLSFNGGKDCTLLLDIIINILKDIHKSENINKRLKVVYIRTNGPFKEIEQFVKQIQAHYKVELMVTEGEMKETLQRILEQDERLKACLMGTRRTDPYSQDLKFMQNTDPGWPQVVRVSPLLNWSYHQIWSYILKRKVPYCSLYDIGYTSIGSVHNTLPNPYLQIKSCCSSYRPAWCLDDGSLERAGRGVKPKETSNETETQCIANGKEIGHI